MAVGVVVVAVAAIKVEVVGMVIGWNTSAVRGTSPVDPLFPSRQTEGGDAMLVLLPCVGADFGREAAVEEEELAEG
jgi:hypothetical protein